MKNIMQITEISEECREARGKKAKERLQNEEKYVPFNFFLFSCFNLKINK